MRNAACATAKWIVYKNLWPFQLSLPHGADGTQDDSGWVTQFTLESCCCHKHYNHIPNVSWGPGYWTNTESIWMPIPILTMAPMMMSVLQVRECSLMGRGKVCAQMFHYYSSSILTILLKPVTWQMCFFWSKIVMKTPPITTTGSSVTSQNIPLVW